MIKLEITQADIDASYEITDKLDDISVDWCGNCPAAIALKRLYPDAVVLVGFTSFSVNSLSFSSDESDHWIRNATDARTQKHLRPSVKPITIELH